MTKQTIISRIIKSARRAALHLSQREKEEYWAKMIWSNGDILPTNPNVMKLIDTYFWRIFAKENQLYYLLLNHCFYGKYRSKSRRRVRQFGNHQNKWMLAFACVMADEYRKKEKRKEQIKDIIIECLQAIVKMTVETAESFKLLADKVAESQLKSYLLIGGE